MPRKMNCFWTLGFCLVVSKIFQTLGKAPKVPSIYDRKFIKEVVDSHNELRGDVKPSAADMNYMYWDKKLAKVAKSWSEKCKFSHNPCTSKIHGCMKNYDVLGENIFLGGIGSTPKFVVSYWYNESKNYNFDTMACSKTCGHYTQVVWAKSIKVGCAVSNCPKLSGGLFVCNYAPAGNYFNTRPYTKGEPCSLCNTKTCSKNLCRGRAAQQRAGQLLILGFILHRIL